MLKKICLLCLAILLLTGCHRDEVEKEEKVKEKDIALVIIAGRHANANMYTKDMLIEANVKNMIKDAIKLYQDEDGKYCAKGQVYVIVSDGYPTEATIEFDQKIDLSGYLECRNNTEKGRKLRVNQMVDGIMDFLTSKDLMADDEEVDLLAALGEAQVILENSDAKEKKILVLDTGVNTTGYFDMSVIDIQKGTPNEVIDSLPDGAIPNLKGTNVQFVNLGNVAKPQVDLRKDSSFKKQLTSVWANIIKRSGGRLEKNLTFTKSKGKPMIYSEDNKGYPYVKTIEFRKAETVSNKPVPLPTSALGFKANSAEFKDEAQAINVITSRTTDLMNYLNENPNEKIYVVGSIAKDSQDLNKPSSVISANRANKVAEVLVNKCKLPANRIVTIDAGTTKFTWRDKEEYPNGKLNVANQESNRIVMIIPESYTREVQELKDAKYIQ